MKKNIRILIFLGLIALVLGTGAVFASSSTVEWEPAGWRLLAGTAALSLATLYTISLLDGRRAALVFMVTTLVISWLAEAIGLQGNLLFGGAYIYHADVQPLLPGGVPLFIPFAWFVLSGLPVMLLRSLKTTHPDGTLNGRQLIWKSALGAWGVMACDLALAPSAVSAGLWSWDRLGAYFEIPLMNFVGWWVVAFVVFLVGYGWAGLGRKPLPSQSLRYDLVWGGAYGLLLLLLAVAASNRMDCGLPVWVALAAISPLSLRWLNEVFCEIKIRRGGRGILQWGGAGGGGS